MVCFTFAYDGDFHVPDLVEPDAARPYSSQNDVVHAAGFQRDVLLFPGRLGALLVVKQYFVHCPAVDDQ